MRVILAILIALMMTPLAAAESHGPGPDEHVRLVADVELAGERYYVIEDHGAIYAYRETNGVLVGGVDGSGLQPAAFCLDGETVTYVEDDAGCALGMKTPADERVTNGVLLELVLGFLPEPVHDLLHPEH